MIAPGTKFTCIAFRSFSLEETLLGSIDVGHGCAALPRCPASLVDRLPTWLGAIQAEAIKRANLVLLANGYSTASITLNDAELATLERRVEFFLWGIAIAAGVPHYAGAITFSGGNEGQGEAIRRTAAEANKLWVTDGMAAARVTVPHTADACGVVTPLERLEQSGLLYDRLRRGVNALVAAMRAPRSRPDERIHQSVRAVEAFTRECFQEGRIRTTCQPLRRGDGGE